MKSSTRVALTISVDEWLWKEAKGKFGRVRDHSFQKIGEALFRSWANQGMPLDGIEAKIPSAQSGNELMDLAIRYLTDPPLASSDQLERIAANQAVALRQTLEMLKKK